MTTYAPDTRITVHPFVTRPEGDEVTIGDVARGVFLRIPAEGLDVLRWLEAGHTVAETARLFEERHGVPADLDDFLAAMAEEGFVSDPQAAAGAPAAGELPPPRPLRAAHFGGITPEAARRWCGPVSLGIQAGIVALGLLVTALDPGVLPGPSALVFTEYFTPCILAVIAVTMIGLFVHEMAHLLVARANGVPARIGISNRLHIMVAETDMSAIWLAPRRQRMLAILAGPLIDVVFAALLVMVLFAGRRGWVPMSELTTHLVAAFTWTYFGRLSFQCAFWLRTDFYYLFAASVNTANLKEDTEAYLRNGVRRVLFMRPRNDLSGLNRTERRTVRGFAVVWLLGHIIMLSGLVFVILPVVFRYVAEVAKLVTGQHTTFGSLDAVTLAILTFTFEGGGIALWLRSFWVGWRTGHRRPATDAGS